MSFHKVFSLIFATVGLSIAAASPAMGHATIVGTTPEQSEAVTDVSHVSVTANEKLLDIGANAKGFVITVRDTDGRFFGDGCVTVKRETASMPVTLTEAGKYRVNYRIVSNDGHPIEGKFTFTVSGIDGAEAAPAFAERPECGVLQSPIVDEQPVPVESEPAGTVADTNEPAPPFDIIPWIGFATIPLIIGAIVLLMSLLGKTDSEDALD